MNGSLGTSSAGATGTSAPDLRVVSHGATPEEVAAVTAVLTAALEELAEQLAVESAPRTSAWARRQRALRVPLVPGPGAWRAFSG